MNENAEEKISQERHIEQHNKRCFALGNFFKNIPQAFMDQHAPSFEQLVMAINELSQQLNNVKNNTVLKEDFTTLTNQLNTFAQQVTEIQSNHAEAIQINAEATRNNTEAIQVNTNRIVTIGREAQNACNILLAKQIELNEQLSAAKRRLSEFEGARESREARSRAARQATKFFED